jgi:hypothetical protein
MQSKALIVMLLLFAGQARAQSLRPLRPDSVARQALPAYLLTPVRVAPAVYYQQHFGVFCKQEWEWEKQTRLPVKLRLGNYQYTQRLEGKER